MIGGLVAAPPDIQHVLEHALAQARTNCEGAPASYIPELARAPVEATSAAITMVDGRSFVAGDHETHRFTLQSSAKLILLIGLLEERGPAQVFARVGAEPTGTSFASLARLDAHGTPPANPLINAGAITLCGTLAGDPSARIEWLREWARRLLGVSPRIDARVLASERATGHRNRSIAYLLKSHGLLEADVEQTLESYFTLCSLEADVHTASRLPAVLARGGLDHEGRRVVSADVAAQVIGIMATCGMYDESGAHLRDTGLPAKSGVSGVIVAVALGHGGIAVASPRLNQQGGSVRGHLMLRTLSDALGWHMGRGLAENSSA